MITRTLARELMQSVVDAGLQYIPRDPEQLQRELVPRINAFESYGKSEDHARRVALHITESFVSWPSVAEIVTACDYIPGTSEEAKRREKCPCCEGTGWQIVRIGDQEGAKKCDHTAVSR